MSSQPISFEQLLAYAAGEISGEQADELRRRIDRDPESAARLARLQATIDTMRGDDSQAAPRGSLDRAKAIFARSADNALSRAWQSLRRVVADLVLDSRGTPALVGFRGGDESFQLVFQAEGLDVDVQLEPGARGWQMLGQISADEPIDDAITVAVARTGAIEPISETQADDHGMFRMPVPVGTHDVLVRVGTRVLVLPSIQVT